MKKLLLTSALHAGVIAAVGEDFTLARRPTRGAASSGLVRVGKRQCIWVTLEQGYCLTQSVYVTLVHKEGVPVPLQPLETTVTDRELEAECATGGTKGRGRGGVG